MWQKYVMNPELIRAYYGTDEYHTLDNAIVKKIEIISGEDNDVKITLDQIAFPIKPPRKWIEQKFNTAQIQLRMIGVTDFSFSFNKFEGIRILKIDIKKNNLNDSNNLIFIASNKNDFDLKFYFRWLSVIGINGYQNG